MNANHAQNISVTKIFFLKKEVIVQLQHRGTTILSSLILDYCFYIIYIYFYEISQAL